LLARFSWDVGPAEIAGLAAEQNHFRGGVDQFGPLFLKRSFNFDRVEALFTYINKRFGGEVDQIAEVPRRIGTALVWTSREKEVREAASLDAEVGLRTAGPMVGEFEAVPATELPRDRARLRSLQTSGDSLGVKGFQAACAAIVASDNSA
jgi:hypothetical protein